MADVTTPPAEPSMEEILASIRKIISDEGNAPENMDSADPELIELTQLVQDDGVVVDLKEAPPVKEPPPQPEPSLPPPEPMKADFTNQELVSNPAADAAVSAFSSLASTIEIERLAALPSDTYLGNGHRTLEDLVIELMRPMLKSWLDKNLPATVDRLVQKEIERIAKRAKE